MKVRRSTAPRLAACLAWAVLLVGCATTSPDPWEPLNRRTFWFNEQLDRFLVEPAARGWDWLMPDVAQTGVAHFFENLGMPVVFVNNLLQLKPRAALDDLGRLLVNSTFGVGGLFDPATRIGIPAHDEDFGQTLGRYGVPPGPYLVLPVLGPSNPRDAVGLAADAAATPYAYFLPLVVTLSARGVEALNFRAAYLEEVRENRETAFDYYVFIRNAYTQYRRHRVEDAAEPADEAEEDLYYWEDEDGGEAP